MPCHVPSSVFCCISFFKLGVRLLVIVPKLANILQQLFLSFAHMPSAESHKLHDFFLTRINNIVAVCRWQSQQVRTVHVIGQRAMALPRLSHAARLTLSLSPLPSLSLPLSLSISLSPLPSRSLSPSHSLSHCLSLSLSCYSYFKCVLSLRIIYKIGTITGCGVKLELMPLGRIKQPSTAP